MDGERSLAAARPASVHVSSHSRQRHSVLSVMALASVSTRLPWQNGHAVGRSTVSLNPNSDIRWCLREKRPSDRSATARPRLLTG